jgi:hypothetical protein
MTFKSGDRWRKGTLVSLGVKLIAGGAATIHVMRLKATFCIMRYNVCTGVACRMCGNLVSIWVAEGR